MSLLNEIAGIPVMARPDLKKSDGSDAGSTDITGKIRPNDVSFSTMRNTINSDGEITGSAVADYLERAGELNDEVDTIPFGLETDDGDIVKVYVNVEQADAFEEKMKAMLGVEDDIEEAINKLAQEFDIVDVVWPKSENNDSSEVLDLDNEGEFDGLDDGDEMDVIAEYDPLKESQVDNGEEMMGEVEDPKEPTFEEAAAFTKLDEIVANLSAQGSSGVAAATGYDRANLTKFEMIAKFIKNKYQTEVALARDWLSRVEVAEESHVLPYWLKEALQTPDHPEQLGEEDMSLGTSFLKRLNEAKSAPKGASFDAGTEQAKSRIATAGGSKNNYGDKIAELLNMCGVPGMYLKKQEVIDSIVAKSKNVQSSGAGPALLSLHAAIKASRGMTMEAKNDNLSGGAFQQMMEEVLVALGAPVDLVGADAKAGVKTAMRRLALEFAQDQTVVKAFRAVARKLGVSITDSATGATKGKLAQEAVTSGTVGTNGKSNAGGKENAGGGEDDGELQGRVTDVQAAAKAIFKAMGVDLNDSTMIRVVNPSALARGIATASRKPAVKSAMGAFLKKVGK